MVITLAGMFGIGICLIGFFFLFSPISLASFFVCGVIVRLYLGELGFVS